MYPRCQIVTVAAAFTSVEVHDALHDSLCALLCFFPQNWWFIKLVLVQWHPICPTTIFDTAATNFRIWHLHVLRSSECGDLQHSQCQSTHTTMVFQNYLLHICKSVACPTRLCRPGHVFRGIMLVHIEVSGLSNDILCAWPWFLKRSPCCICNTSACGS